MDKSLHENTERYPQVYVPEYAEVELEGDCNDARDSLWNSIRNNVYNQMLVGTAYIDKGYIDKGEDRVRGFELISDEQVREDFDKFPVRKLPRRGTAHSAGYDFFAPYSFKLEPNEEIVLPTGIKAYMQDDEYLKIVIRSSFGFKYNFRIKNQSAVVDADYFDNEDNEGHIFIAIKNEGDNPKRVKKGEAIAQGIFQKYLLADGDSLDGEERKGGIGSTNEE